MPEAMLEWLDTHFRDSFLPHWFHAAPTPNGFFRAHLDREWNPVGPPVASLVTQTRLVYVFATGYELTGESAYREAAERGAEFLLRCFRDRRNGGFFWTCDDRGAVLDRTKSAYGHAFALFALAHTYRVTANDAHLAGALHALEILDRRFSLPSGGLIPKMTEDFRERGDRRTQNPMMHFFEALLALFQAGREEARERALSILDFLQQANRSHPEPLISEYYSDDWHPVPSDECTASFDIGHQFEWAWLCSEACRLGFDDALLETGHGLLSTGVRRGYDPDMGGAFYHPPELMPPAERGKTWWIQCEVLRTLLRYGLLHGESSLLPEAERTFALIRDRFVDPEHGGWYGGLDASHRVASHRKGSLWKAGYHVAGLCREAAFLAKVAAVGK